MVVAEVRAQEQSPVGLEHPGQLPGRLRLVLDVMPGAEHEGEVGAAGGHGQVLGGAGEVAHTGRLGLRLGDLAHPERRLDAGDRPERARQRRGVPAGP